ncbi:MAG: cob(I)yrinic acid a,c-diamide adenosyltransferase [Deltaproteobacteria bacterium]|jgi:cob(I)alamin adenosyltransferase|nr:cob(I)yrinic acid a,c-diamide adenosyltransferase [Deltaproteobacteria bacterium]
MGSDIDGSQSVAKTNINNFLKMEKLTHHKGCIQIYTGNGKGKTTAAIGLAIRASGYGMKTYIGQFMKGQHYGELTALLNHPHITIEQYGDIECVHREEVTQKHIDQAQQGLKQARKAMHSHQYDIIILDEINVAVWFELITTEEVLELLNERPRNVELILTGRYAPEAFIEIADLVSDVKEIKHYYNRGVKARTGFER